ncbi:aminodeoxychorismate lyase [Gordoniibacillus kamchatkensis]|uniref:Endolytic murein transglycosylase n=2 Tax=Gordoniibacillus kamchatkensis TaxID=1590651 RepID=A0ABR5AKQ2_9BACL|nr:aminodeoxychorismate lyase [Paenibacillus sp. VKM B-2647]
MIVAALFIVIALGAITGAALYVSQALRPVPASSQEVRFTVPAGSRPAQIAGILERSGLIRDDRIFTYYLKWRKEGSRFQAGEYAMTPGTPLDAIIAKLNDGDTVKEDTIRLTIPEGYTAVQIADKIAQATGQSNEEVMRLIDRPGAYRGAVIPALPDSPQVKHKAEGYLFPETYEFKKGTGPEEMVQRMLAETDGKIAAIPGWDEQLKRSGFTLHQVLTIASLVEREVVLDEERPVVAGIIVNRLKRNMPLQIDATVQYLFDKPKDRLVEKDLQLESPYNTYLHTGLPPGPIASPSAASIRAALSPADTKYLFYVTKKDGSKGHLFAETFEQHKKNIAASKTQEGK